MNETPEFWTPQELTEEELNKICSWLMAWQKAMVSADCVMSDFDETLPTSRIDPNFMRAMSYVQDLVRHIGALRKKDNNDH